MSTLICLGAGLEGLPIIERAKALGHKLYVVDANPRAPGMGLADWKVVASCYDPQAVVYPIRQTGATHPSIYPPQGVICCAIDAPHVAAAVAREFGLPGLTLEQAALSVDKLAQKTRLRGAGLPVPDFHGWERIVVKPPASRGARGVRLIETGGVVEEYLGGPQLSTESIIQNGRVLFTAIGLRNYDRLAEFAPFVIEDGYDMPYGDAGLGMAVDALLGRACEVLGWNDLTVKGDWIIHDGKLVILELAARLSGGFFGTHGIPLAYGTPFVDWAIQSALGARVPKSIAVPTTPHNYVSQRYVFPEPGDIGRRVKIVAPYLNTDFHTYALHIGEVIAPVVSHGQRWGQATCTGATPQQARERAEWAVAAMKAAVVLE